MVARTQTPTQTRTRTRLAYVLAVLGLAACTASAERTELREAAENAASVSVDDANDEKGEDTDSKAEADPVSADQVEIVRGVPDRNRDPAVVALLIDGKEGKALCTGTLISQRLVLTARHCMSRTTDSVSCPPTGVHVLGDRDPRSVQVIVGDDIASGHVVARGSEVIAPSGTTLCEADIAVLMLDRPVKVVKPLPVRSRGVVKAERIRAVGYGRTGDPYNAEVGTKLMREHVRVLSVSPAEFKVGEASCHGDSGGPALDQDTGEILGVVSRGGPTCAGSNVHNIYTRADAFSWLIAEAFAKVSGLDRAGDEAVSPDAGASDAGASAPSPTPAPKGTKQKPPSDMGGPCTQGAQCASGVCITDPAGMYCSRPCGSGDRCPARYHCKAIRTGASSGAKACIAVK